MPPTPEVKNYFEILQKDINTFHGEEEIRKACLELFMLIKAHNYDPEMQNYYPENIKVSRF
jgi:hypothetical protein